MPLQDRYGTEHAIDGARADAEIRTAAGGATARFTSGVLAGSSTAGFFLGCSGWERIIIACATPGPHNMIGPAGRAGCGAATVWPDAASLPLIAVSKTPCRS